MNRNGYELNLDKWMILDIMDNCFGNIFIVDSSSKVIFANKNCVTAFGVPRDRIIGQTTQDLVDTGILTRSTSQECLEKKEVVIGTVKSQLDIEMLNISKPVYDDYGNLSFIMTYGQTSDNMGEFLRAIEDEKSKTQNYREALKVIGGLDSNTRDVVLVSEKMKKIFSVIDTVAPTDGTITLLGESGVGKDVIANYIHKASKRKDEPFIPINCAAIPANLMESEFFGYEKGAFTGAQANGKMGFFEIANHGTLFLDEIGELPLDMQTKFLRVIETGMVQRIGGSKQIKTDVRLIAATNRDLVQMIHNKEFREDLYFRLNVLSFVIPPLRERTEAIEPLAISFVNRFNKKYKKNFKLSNDALDKFKKYRWHGNIRELRNVIERMVLTMDEQFMPTPIHTEKDESIPISINTTSNMYRQEEQKKVIDVLLSVNGNKSKAAKILGISRGKLYKLLSE